MRQYLVSAPLSLYAGAVLALSAEQAARRVPALWPLDDGLYEVRQPVQFKAGEVIGFGGDLPKHLASLLEPVAPDVPAPEAAAEAAPKPRAAHKQR